MHRIGSGSYGEVWLARNAVGTLRAVKVVRRASFKNDRPYEREFSGMLKFEPVSRSHEGLMDILQLGRNDPEGYFYYVMELADDAKVAVNDPLPESEPVSSAVSSESALSQPNSEDSTEPRYRPLTLSVAKAIQGQLPLQDCLRHFSTLSSALGALHSAGLIHRDIKPSNIILVNGIAKLADIGLVTDVDDTRSFVGTEGFIPPEGPGSAQADLYSLGKVLYEVATGRDRKDYPSLPLGADSKNPPRDLLELNAIISRACAADLKQRYANAAEMHADLAVLQSGRSVRHLHAFENRLRAAKRMGLVFGVISVMSIAAFALASWTARIEREAREKTQLALERVEAAERDARSSLYDSLVARAVAERRSDLVGRRFAAIDAISAASRIRPAALELRNAAISAMALPDVRLIHEYALPSWGHAHCLSQDLELRFIALTNGGVKVLRSSDDVELYEFGEKGDPYTYVSPVGHTGRWITLLRGDSTSALWDIREKRFLGKDEVHQGLSFSEDDRWMYHLRPGKAIVVLDLQTQQVRELSLEGEDDYFLTPIANDVLAVAPRNAPTIRFVSIASGKILARMQVLNDQPVTSMLASPDGLTLVLGFVDGTLAIYDTRQLSGPRSILSAHVGNIVGLSFHPDGDWLLTTSWDGSTKLVGVGEGQVISLSRSGNSLHGFTRDGRRASGLNATSGMLQTFECRGREVCRTLGETQPMKDRQPGPWNGGFSPDGRLLVTASYDGLRLYDTQDGQELSHFSSRGWFAAQFVGTSNIVSAGFNGLARWPMTWRSPDDLLVGQRSYSDPGGHWYFAASARGDVLASATTEGEILIYRDGKEHTRIRHHQNIRGVTLSRDGRLMACRSEKPPGTVVWDTQSGQLVTQFLNSHPGASGLNSDGSRIILSERGGLVVQDVRTQGVIWRTPVERGSLCLTWSPDDQLIAALQDGSVLVLLKASTGEILARLEHPNALPYNNTAFDASGSQIACFSTGHRTHLWNLRALRKELAALDLDWDMPPFPDRPLSSKVHVEIQSPRSP